MDRIDVGLQLNGFRRDTLGRTGARIEELGYTSLWVGDHLSFAIDGITASAILLGATRSVRVGTAVYLLPLRGPAAVARSLVTLARQGQDRFTFGVGAGALEEDFAAAGVPRAGRGARLERDLAAVRGHLAEPEFWADTAGEPPRPAPAPPIWIGGRSEHAAARAGRVGDGYLPYFVTVEQFAGLRDVALGHRPEGSAPLSLASCVLVGLGRDEDAALETARGWWRPFPVTDDQLRRYCVLGDAEACLAGLRRFVAAGARTLVIEFVCHPDEKEDHAVAFAREVLPTLLADPEGGDR